MRPGGACAATFHWPRSRLTPHGPLAAGAASASGPEAASGFSTRRWHGQAGERGPNPASARPSTTSGIPDPAWRGRSTRRARSRPAADTAEPHDEPAPRSGDDTIKAHGEPGRAPALTPTTSHGEPGLDPAMTPPSHTAKAARSGAGTIQGPAAPPSRSARRPFRIPRAPPRAGSDVRPRPFRNAVQTARIRRPGHARHPDGPASAEPDPAPEPGRPGQVAGAACRHGSETGPMPNRGAGRRSYGSVLGRRARFATVLKGSLRRRPRTGSDRVSRPPTGDCVDRRTTSGRSDREPP